MCAKMWKNVVEPERPQITTERKRIARWVRTVTHTHTRSMSPPPPMPPHVFMNFRGFPPGCGDSVADF